jgi:hypothetical protein
VDDSEVLIGKPLFVPQLDGNGNEEPTSVVMGT